MHAVSRRALSVFVSVAICLLVFSVAITALPSILPASADQHGGNGNDGNSNKVCQLSSGEGQVQHVIYIQFDNLHFTRDNPNVPSDLEQMPALLNFMEQNGVLMTNHHTPIISHTANDILTSLTGVYPNNLGQAVANAYGYFNPSGTVSFASSFTYWTDHVGGTDSNYNLLTATGQNAPAPWVPFTRAGCNVGAVGTANLELENVGSDLSTVFSGTQLTSAKAEASSNYYQAVADYEGIAVHCASGSGVCSTANGGVSDVLPDEPGGYSGFGALFGNKYVAPLINNGNQMTDLYGNVVSDGYGHVGFPGFDGMSPAVSLSYVAAMQEHGIPVTYAYISDAHDNHATGTAFGPGEAGYVAQLAAYNQAFATFFARLQADGITPKNTLFVITADENDHFVGGLPAPSNCDGVNVPCTYGQVGEVDAYLNGLLPASTPAFDIHFDSAPVFYVHGNPSPTDSATRSFERTLAGLQVVNPISGATDSVTQYLANPVELNIMHMVTADPARTPTFIDFANPDYYFTAGASYNNYCSPSYVCIDSSYAWNHGDVQSVIVTTWLGLVGPGVVRNGLDTVTWSDHTDIRPTMMFLLGLKDDYNHDGRVLVEALDGPAIFHAMHDSDTYTQLAQAYEQINAPTGQLAMNTLVISTHALSSNTPGDATYTALENQLTSITTQRNAIASQMISLLEGAAFQNQHIDEGQARTLISQAQNLLTQTNALAALPA
jgi:hypothetical protein